MSYMLHLSVHCSAWDWTDNQLKVCQCVHLSVSPPVCVCVCWVNLQINTCIFSSAISFKQIRNKFGKFIPNKLWRSVIVTAQARRLTSGFRESCLSFTISCSFLTDFCQVWNKDNLTRLHSWVRLWEKTEVISAHARRHKITWPVLFQLWFSVSVSVIFIFSVISFSYS